MYDGYNETRSYDPLWSQQELSSTYQLPRDTRLTKLPSRRRGMRHLMRFLTVLLVLALVGLAGNFGVKYFQTPKGEGNEKKKTLLNASMMNDLAATIIMIPSEDQHTVYNH